jgi:KDO2-lipid IV(A) lauroyltransferase
MIKRLVSYAGIACLYLLSLLPLAVLYLISDVLMFLLFHVIRYRRKVVEMNLRNAFPEKSEEEILRISRKFYRNLGDIMVEILKMITISREEFARRVTVINTELEDEYYRNNTCIIAVAGHYANWEWMSLASDLHLRHDHFGAYKPLSNPYFDKAFINWRSRFGTRLIPMKEVLRTVIKNRDKLFALGLISDQTPTKNESVYWTTFLNQPTSVFLGPEKIAKMINCKVVFFDMRRIKRGYYELEVVPLAEDPSQLAEYELTERHVRYLENRIRQKPEDWLWSHRRWKHQPTADQRIKFNV